VTIIRLLRTATFRFAALCVVVFGLSAAALGCIAYFTVRDALERSLDRNIESEASSLAAAYRTGGLDQLRSIMTDQDRVASWHFRYRVTSADGRTVVDGLNIANKSIGWSKHEPKDPQPSQVALRALTVTLGDQHRLSVASYNATLRDIEQALLQTFGGVLAAALFLGLGGGLLVSSRFLGRVDRITSTAQLIMNGDPKQRIPLRSTNDDLDRLAGTLNAMLDRINELMESLRQVSNDIAHDLRTPLSRMQQKLELAVASNFPEEQLRECM
jgi:signal transduction histidine kinase